MADRFMPSESWRARRSDGFFEGGLARLGLAGGAVIGLLGLAYGGYAMLGHSTRALPVVEADQRPMRVRPDNPGGMQVIGAEEHVAGTVVVTAPPPEAPAPQALRAKIRAEAALARPVVQSVSIVSPPPVPAAPIASMPERAARPAPSASGMQVQLAAATSEQGARSEWQRLSHHMPVLFAARQPVVQRADRGGHVIYRLRTGAFADTASANAFCVQIRAAGADCSLASF